MDYKYLFGPVPSRRLGLSLGVDLVPFKTCSYNCIYCECGGTTALTKIRKEYVAVEEVISELKAFFRERPLLDTVTFSGSGEPTLHSGIGKIIAFLKKEYPEYKTALLTNGCFLGDRSVREELYGLDLFLPSLDAGSEEVFRRINRSHEAFTLHDLVEGLVLFRKEYKGTIWLEVFIVPGMNDNEEELKHIREAVTRIDPDKVQLNTLDRPGTEYTVRSLSRESMEQIAKSFQKHFSVEIIASFPGTKVEEEMERNMENAVLGMIARRPCTEKDLVTVLGGKEDEVRICLKKLIMQKKVEIKESERGFFYRSVCS